MQDGEPHCRWKLPGETEKGPSCMHDLPHSGYGHDGRSQNWEIFTGAVQQAKKKHEGKMEVWLQADKRCRSPLSVEPAISACYTLV